MSIQDLFRILLDSEEIIIVTNKNFVKWRGYTKDIPYRLFDYLIDVIYSASDSGESCIIIILK